MGVGVPLSKIPAQITFGVLILMGISEIAFTLSGWTTSISHSPEYVVVIFVLISFVLIGVGLSGIYIIETKLHPPTVQIWSHLYGVLAILFIVANAINITLGIMHIQDIISACEDTLFRSPKLFGSLVMWNYAHLKSNCTSNVPIMISATAAAVLLALVIMVFFARYPKRYIQELKHSLHIQSLLRANSIDGPLTMARQRSTRRAVSISSNETSPDKSDLYEGVETNNVPREKPLSFPDPYRFQSNANIEKTKFKTLPPRPMYKTDLPNIPAPVEPLSIVKSRGQRSILEIDNKMCPQASVRSKQFSTSMLPPSSPSSMYSASSYADTILDNEHHSKNVSKALYTRLGRSTSIFGSGPLPNRGPSHKNIDRVRSRLSTASKASTSLARMPTGNDDYSRSSLVRRSIPYQSVQSARLPSSHLPGGPYQSVQSARLPSSHLPSVPPVPDIDPEMLGPTPSVLRKAISGENVSSANIDEPKRAKGKVRRRQRKLQPRGRDSPNINRYPSLRARFVSPIIEGHEAFNKRLSGREECAEV